MDYIVLEVLPSHEHVLMLPQLAFPLQMVHDL